jgi:hypothetical protein
MSFTLPDLPIDWEWGDAPAAISDLFDAPLTWTSSYRHAPDVRVTYAASGLEFNVSGEIPAAVYRQCGPEPLVVVVEDGARFFGSVRAMRAWLGRRYSLSCA